MAEVMESFADMEVAGEEVVSLVVGVDFTPVVVLVVEVGAFLRNFDEVGFCLIAVDADPQMPPFPAASPEAPLGPPKEGKADVDVKLGVEAEAFFFLDLVVPLEPLFVLLLFFEFEE